MSQEEPVDNYSTSLTCKIFPNLVNGKIVTFDFLEASQEVVHFVVFERYVTMTPRLSNLWKPLTGVAYFSDSLGRVFAPLSYDMSGNIGKLKKSFDRNQDKFMYIEDLILYEKTEGQGVAIDALLWLTRALQFMLVFFECIAYDTDKSEALADHMTTAYSRSLEPYHGWATKKLFAFFRKMVPSRSALLSAMAQHPSDTADVTTNHLQEYVQPLASAVRHISQFYQLHGLQSDAKAP